MCLFISCLISNTCSTTNSIFSKGMFEKPNIFIERETNSIPIKLSNTLSKEQSSTINASSTTHLKKTEPISPLMKETKHNEKNVLGNSKQAVQTKSNEVKREKNNDNDSLLSKNNKLERKESNKKEINKTNLDLNKSGTLLKDNTAVSKSLETKDSKVKISKQDPVDPVNNTSDSTKVEPAGPLEFQAKCFIRVPKGEEFVYYNLSNIKTFKTNILGAKLTVNLCDYAPVEPCNSRGDYGMIQDSDCIVYSESKSEMKSWVVEENKFTITMPEGRKCTGKGQNPDYYKVKVTIKCDEELVREAVVDSASDFDTCKPNIVMRSAHVCGGEKFQTWIEASKLSPGIVTFLLIALGLTILLFGNKLRVVFCVVIIWLCSTVALFIFVEPVFDFPNSCKYFLKYNFNFN